MPSTERKLSCKPQFRMHQGFSAISSTPDSDSVVAQSDSRESARSSSSAHSMTQARTMDGLQPVTRVKPMQRGMPTMARWRDFFSRGSSPTSTAICMPDRARVW